MSLLFTEACGQVQASYPTRRRTEIRAREGTESGEGHRLMRAFDVFLGDCLLGQDVDAVE